MDRSIRDGEYSVNAPPHRMSTTQRLMASHCCCDCLGLHSGGVGQVELTCVRVCVVLSLLSLLLWFSRLMTRVDRVS